MSLLLLDTNILIHGARRSDVWAQIVSLCDPMLALPIPLVHIVSHGESLSFAEQRSWGEERRKQLTYLLGYFEMITIDPLDLDSYALLDSYSRRKGFRMGKNDLWIAAAAHTSGATIVTTDRDFDHLDGKFLQRLWIDPTTP
ncbi:type II toxin-antitoxin system VapC family toxin [Armatimonas rosea]|uniref:Putative nucleic acid-binding protein n=1 Tax=Armatimonas rosea TaxID=685828 RepID=A0A7W9SR91_ARMRO|nr:type II toxin-antitoxin system VapC family toxin [Armatimonas rosea]MBB6051357.1 putative nucleic acid-binding protein [Armatimonas rosea]